MYVFFLRYFLQFGTKKRVSWIFCTRARNIWVMHIEEMRFGHIWMQKNSVSRKNCINMHTGTPFDTFQLKKWIKYVKSTCLYSKQASHAQPPYDIIFINRATEIIL